MPLSPVTSSLRFRLLPPSPKDALEKKLSAHVVLMQPLPLVLQHQLIFLGDQDSCRHFGHSCQPASQSYSRSSGSGGTPDGGLPDGGGSSDAQPLPATLQQYIFLAADHPCTH